MLITNDAEMTAAINDLGGGMHQIAAGQYGQLRIVDKGYSANATFVAENLNDPPRFGFSKNERSSNFRLEGLHFSGVAPSTSNPGAVELRDCDDYEFIGNTVVGGEACVKMGGGNNIRVSSNTLSGCSGTEIKYWGLAGFEIDHNLLLGIMFPDANTHGDRIQMVGNCSRGRIHHNRCYFDHRPRENGQDPSLWGKIYQGGFFDNGVADDIEIDNNIFMHTGAGGLVSGASYSGTNIRAHHNLVFNVPGRDHPQLTGDYGSDNTTETSNLGIAGATHWANIGQSGADFVLQKDDPTAPDFANNVFENLMRGMGYVDDDFRPKAGGPADFGTDMGPQSLFAEMFNGAPPPMPDVITAVTLGQPQVAGVDFNDLVITGPGPAPDFQVSCLPNDPDFVDTVDVPYTITDGEGLTDSSVMHFTFAGDPPVANEDFSSGPKGVAQILLPTANDIADTP